MTLTGRFLGDPYLNVLWDGRHQWQRGAAIGASGSLVSKNNSNPLWNWLRTSKSGVGHAPIPHACHASGISVVTAKKMSRGLMAP